MSINWTKTTRAGREAYTADTPEARARREQMRREEHERGVRFGWWDEDGNPLPGGEGDGDEDEGEEA